VALPDLRRRLRNLAKGLRQMTLPEEKKSGRLNYLPVMILLNAHLAEKGETISLPNKESKERKYWKISHRKNRKRCGRNGGKEDSEMNSVPEDQRLGDNEPTLRYTFLITRIQFEWIGSVRKYP